VGQNDEGTHNIVRRCPSLNYMVPWLCPGSRKILAPPLSRFWLLRVSLPFEVLVLRGFGRWIVIVKNKMSRVTFLWFTVNHCVDENAFRRMIVHERVNASKCRCHLLNGAGVSWQAFQLLTNEIADRVGERSPAKCERRCQLSI